MQWFISDIFILLEIFAGLELALVLLLGPVNCTLFTMPNKILSILLWVLFDIIQLLLKLIGYLSDEGIQKNSGLIYYWSVHQ